MNRREYEKYNQEVYDMRKKRILPGDTVIINNNYRADPHIGEVTHFTRSGKVAVRVCYSTCGKKKYYFNNYRQPDTIIKFRSGHKNNNKNQAQSKPQPIE
jgi:hypothetical protein